MFLLLPCQFFLPGPIEDEAEDDDEAGEINEKAAEFRSDIPETGAAQGNVAGKFIFPGQREKMSEIADPKALFHERARRPAEDEAHRDE